jgi:predicted dehydrogenase
MLDDATRRRFLHTSAAAAGAAIAAGATAPGAEPAIQGFEEAAADADASKGWKPVSDRKLRVGLVGHGVCQFAAAFGFQDHPNVQVVAVSDLIPDRCAALARAARCDKTYESLEKLIRDAAVEAVFIATDAPSHARHAIEALKHDKHVASAVPACFGSLDEAEQLFDAVKSATGLNYMMFETSCFHEDLFAMRQVYQAGGFGKIAYAEGEYYHFMPEPIDSYRGWRIGLPPQWYPTHSNAYYIGVTGGSFVEVSCQGMPSTIAHLRPDNNAYKNPFGTEIALFRTSEGGSARMAVSWDTPGASGEMGRIRGQKGSYYGKFEGPKQALPDTRRPPLPPTVQPGGHGGSHGYLMNEFVEAILEDRAPSVGVADALNMTVAGIVAHQSALKDGALMKIPQFRA